MRYAMIMAGGSGVRLWPMSRGSTPKQLIPFIGGKSLLRIAVDRLDGLVPPERLFVCAGEKHRELILQAVPDLAAGQFLGEPVGRDTTAAVGFSAAVIALRDPGAVIAVFTADHLIRPVGRFQELVGSGYALVEKFPDTLLTFGVTPTAAATGYGYLQLGEVLEGSARVVERFQEKPGAETAGEYFAAGPERYLWNSGMFIWRASTLLDCLRRYETELHAGLMRIAGSPPVIAEVYPGLKKISVDYAVMEPASRDPAVRVAAIPMDLEWLDVGSWPAFATTCPRDENANALAAGKQVLLDTRNTLVASNDPNHVIATVGCDGLIIIHTSDATLVCRADRAESVKKLQQMVGERYGPEYL